VNRDVLGVVEGREGDTLGGAKKLFCCSEAASALAPSKFNGCAFSQGPSHRGRSHNWRTILHSQRCQFRGQSWEAKLLVHLVAFPQGYQKSCALSRCQEAAKASRCVARSRTSRSWFLLGHGEIAMWIIVPGCEDRANANQIEQVLDVRFVLWFLLEVS
jgi:hypothetical protein